MGNMTKDRLLKRIAQLGSLSYQVSWVVHGNAAEYVLLDELVETTAYAAKHTASDPLLSTSLSQTERDALITFHDRADELYELIPWHDPKVSIADIVERNQSMQQIRDAANECLRTLGITFSTEELMCD